MKTELEKAPVDLDVLCREADKALHDEEELLKEIRRDIEEYHLIWNLKAENKGDTLRSLIAKIKAKWREYCE